MPLLFESGPLMKKRSKGDGRSLLRTLAYAVTRRNEPHQQLLSSQRASGPSPPLEPPSERRKKREQLSALSLAHGLECPPRGGALTIMQGDGLGERARSPIVQQPPRAREMPTPE